MHAAETVTDIEAFYNEYSKSRYPDKVTLYDKQFGIVPFSFPAFNIGMSWYMNHDILKSLSEVLAIERRELNSLYVKKIRTKTQSYEFSVLPVYIPERKYLNEYIFNKFRCEKAEIDAATAAMLRNNSSPEHFLEEKIATITHHLEWIPLALKANVPTDQSKFLRIFYNGVQAAKSGHVATTHVRRKFVEIYLYTQGYLLIDHLNNLIDHYSELNINAGLNPLSLRLKLVMLHQLGIVDNLKKKLKPHNGSDNLRVISKLISLLMAENPGNYQEIFRYLTLLGSGHPGDLLTPLNRHLVESRLMALEGVSPVNITDIFR